MRKSNFPLRLLPSLAEELKRVSAEEGVSVNTYINVAIAEKLAVRQTAAEFFAEREKGGSPSRALEILEMAGREDEPEPEGSDELLEA
ncbi:toxin-antitoxin system HicB family antitoxin [Methylocaldum szegediense]|uniref:Toxin-antitoxin system antitoxin (Possibly HicB family) n=1 Tax=Methylocaldum szegediense TaxID=73780 RepID=A0ABN8XAR8_9GAMM|nr:toxin-antitoxin system HicB family antitoxin [Methylocaldum szegediense]CAI8981363.1 Toxin-antitoxin system antitoxin (possibly HicB family) [Methylocaldum szegediense]